MHRQLLLAHWSPSRVAVDVCADFEHPALGRCFLCEKTPKLCSREVLRVVCGYVYVCIASLVAVDTDILILTVAVTTLRRLTVVVTTVSRTSPSERRCFSCAVSIR